MLVSIQQTFSTGKIEYMQMPTAWSNLVGIIYVQFGDLDAGNFLKNNFLRDELKECVPITAITKTFPYSHKNKIITVQWKQSPLELCHAFTV